MLLPELKAELKSRGVSGYSGLKKADLIQMLEATDEPKLGAETEETLASALDNSTKSNVVSNIDAIKAAIRIDREDRSNRGRNAGNAADKTTKQTLAIKVEGYRNQNNGGKMTPKQARRYRKAYNQGALVS